MLEPQKIIITGPTGVGKTTAIKAISDELPASTGALASDETPMAEDKIGVDIDYGALCLDNGSKLKLYGAVDKEQFNIIWDVLAESGAGLVLLLDNTRNDPLDDMSLYLDAFKDFITGREVVIGVNRYEEKSRPGLYSYNTRLKEHGIKAPVFEIDSRVKSDIKILLLTLMAMLDPSLKR